MKNSLNLIIAILIFVVLGCGCPKLSDLSKKERVTAPTPAPFLTPSSNSAPIVKKGEYDVTMEKYNQISVGTKRADVESILGGKGTEISNTVGGGVRFSVNKWEGDNFASVILSFRNDKVMTKSQVALK